MSNIQEIKKCKCGKEVTWGNTYICVGSAYLCRECAKDVVNGDYMIWRDAAESKFIDHKLNRKHYSNRRLST